MATVQTDGTSAVTSTSTDNNGGTVKANGSASGTFQTNATANENVGVFGSSVIQGVNTEMAIEGTFAFNNAKPVAKRISTTLSTVSNDVLLSGAAQPGLIRSIHKLEVLRTRRATLAIRTGHFNMYTGKYDGGYPVVAVDSLGVDDAANPTRDFTGELQYLSGSPIPTLDEYKEKTG